jgi:hypothetical protein
MLAVVFMIAVLGSLLRQRRSPGATIAWLMLIVLMPPIGLPAYFFLGGRKLRNLSTTKDKIQLKPDSARRRLDAHCENLPGATALTATAATASVSRQWRGRRRSDRPHRRHQHSISINLRDEERRRQGHP